MADDEAGHTTPTLPNALELFGHVSYVQPEQGEPAEFRAVADFTDVLAEDSPGWKIDLNDEVIGPWRGENGRAGAVTLVWGRPLVQATIAATAELDGETVDQEEKGKLAFSERSPAGLDALSALEDLFNEEGELKLVAGGHASL